MTSAARRLEVPEGSNQLLVFVALNAGKVERRHAAGPLWPYGDDVRAAGNVRSALWRLRGAGINALTCDKQTLALRPGTLVDVDLLCGWAERATDTTVPLAAIRAEPLRESAQRALPQAHLSEGNIGEARQAFDQYRRLLARELGVAPSTDLTAMVVGAFADRTQHEPKPRRVHLVNTGDCARRPAHAPGDGRVMAVTEALVMRSRSGPDIMKRRAVFTRAGRGPGAAAEQLSSRGEGST